MAPLFPPLPTATGAVFEEILWTLESHMQMDLLRYQIYWVLYSVMEDEDEHDTRAFPPTWLYSTLVSSDDQSKWVFGWVRIYGRHQMGFYDTYNINSSSGQPPPLTSSLCPLPASSSSRMRKRMRMRMRMRIRILYPLLLYLQSEGHLYRAIGHSIRTILISRPLHHLQWALYDF